MDLIFAIIKKGKMQTAETIVITIYPNKTLTFAKTQGTQVMKTTIEGLRLNPATIVNEFPDLKDKPAKEVKKIGIQRFKEHIESMDSLQEIKEYLQKDLSKHGYTLIGVKRPGHRSIKVN